MAASFAAVDARQLQQITSAILIDVLDAATEQRTFPCVPLVHTALTTLYDDGIVPLMRTSATVVSACLRFLTCPRDDQDIGRLFHDTAVCVCDMTNPFVRRLHAHVEDGVNVYDVFELLVEVAYDTLHHLGPVWSNIKNARKAARRCQRPWPSCAADLVPYGSEASAKALCSWGAHYPSTRLLKLVERYRAHVLPGNQPHSFVFAVIPLVIMPMIRRVILAVEDDDPEFWVELVQIGEAMQMMLLSEDCVVRAVTAVDSAWPKEFAELCICTYLAVAYLHQLHHKVSDDQAMYLKQLFLAIGGRFRAALGLPREDFVSDNMDQEALRLTDHQGVMRFLMLAGPAQAFYTGHLHRCGNPGCPQTDLSAWRILKACAGCGATFYCSRACQRASWRVDVMPHREGCHKLRAFKDALRPYMASDRPAESKELVDACEAATLDEETVSYVTEFLRHHESR